MLLFYVHCVPKNIFPWYFFTTFYGVLVLALLFCIRSHAPGRARAQHCGVQRVRERGRADSAAGRTGTLSFEAIGVVINARVFHSWHKHETFVWSSFTDAFHSEYGGLGVSTPIFCPIFVSFFAAPGAQLEVKSVVAMGGGLHLVQMDEIGVPMSLLEFENDD
jgi:hypothetical protein